MCTVLFFSCNRTMGTTKDYSQLASRHQLLAILPTESIILKEIPEVKLEYIEAIEKAEGKAIQIAFYDRLLAKSGEKIHVKFQH